MLDAATHALQLENFRRDQVLELRLKSPPLTEAVTIASFFEQVASPSPTPGGGTVAAFVGALSTCLATMVANLTVGKKKYAASEAALLDLKRDAETLRGELLTLARLDSEAFDAVLRARRLPQATPGESAERQKALERAGVEATRVPLRTAAACLKAVELAQVAARLGNVNAASDAGVAGLLARAAAEGAILNVRINLKSLDSQADREDIETNLQRLQTALETTSRGCLEAVHAALHA